MTALRVACAVLAALTAGCWASMPVRESAGSAGPLPAVVAPEAEPALAPEDDGVAPLDVDPIDDDAPAPEPSATLEVEATLVEVGTASHCGIAKWVVVMRYEVRRVIAGTYTARDLYVAHACPEMGLSRCRGGAGERIARFRAGDVHRLQLRRGTGGGAVVDKFEDRALPRYRSRCGEMVAPSGA
ncbi:MAG TPA: hypothetical protein VIK91_18125 [Nannocystis sp.]